MYKRGRQGWLKHIDFVIIDLICLHISYIVAYMIRHGLQFPYTVSRYFNLGIVISLMALVASVLLHTFSGVLKRGFYREFVVTLEQVIVVIMGASLYMFAIQQSETYSRVTIALTGGFYLVISYGGRILWKQILKKRKITIHTRSVLVITERELAEKTITDLAESNLEKLRVSGLVLMDCDMTGEKIMDVPVVAGRDDVIEYICREWVEEVFINVGSHSDELLKIARDISKMGIVLHTRFLDDLPVDGRMRFTEPLGPYKVTTTTMNVISPKQLFFKRAFDILAGIIGCIFTGLLCLVMAPVIWVKSPGPLFFNQIRVGQFGKKFKMYKFRTMYMDAEERKKDFMAENRNKDGFMFKLDFDPRIIGNKVLEDGTQKRGFMDFARRASLDEFPQFFNVLIGNMSVCGTRPPTVDEWEKYELHHRARISIRPGLTGLWQVSGRSEITDFNEVVKLDTEYISNWNYGLDIKIILKTIGLIFTRKGSL